jgi:hypothetical protein
MFRPAVERSQRVSGGQPRRPDRSSSGGGSGPDLAEPGTPLHRSQILSAFMNVMGMSKAAAEAQYERQLAQWHAEQAGRA